MLFAAESGLEPPKSPFQELLNTRNRVSKLALEIVATGEWQAAAGAKYLLVPAVPIGAAADT